MSTSATAITAPNPTDIFSMAPGVLVDETFLASVLSISVKTLRNWRSLKTGPKALRIGASVRYRIGDVTRWIEESNDDE